jgi:hypothetical protein
MKESVLMTVVNVGDRTSKEALFEIAALIGANPHRNIVEAVANLMAELEEERDRVRVLERDLALADEEIAYLNRSLRYGDR